MTTPFPGMDPYLEHPAFWCDFHQSFITSWRDWLLDHLPEHYDVRIDERLGVVEETGGVKSMLPDLSVIQGHPLPERLPPETALATLGREPVELSVKYAEEETEAYLRVVHRPEAALIAVLELLSPPNKEGKGRQLYLEKRNKLLEETVHLVEIDLLLGGSRVPIEGSLPAADYYAFIARGDQRPRCEVYSWKLSEPLTPIRLPLKQPDPDLVFDLPGLFRVTYHRGRYTRNLPYSDPPLVPLPEQAAKWVCDSLNQWKNSGIA